jgi:hypothetical protein
LKEKVVKLKTYRDNVENIAQRAMQMVEHDIRLIRQ